MFKWTHEYTYEVNIPIHKVWEFSANTSNWPKWMDQVESCALEGAFKAGSNVKGKIKNRNLYLNMLIKEATPYGGFKLFIKMLLITQESQVNLQELSQNRTSITSKTSVTSILVPFMKSFLRRKIEEQTKTCLKVFLEEVEK